MHNKESVWENEIQKNFRDFEIQTDHRLPIRKLKVMLINKTKRACHLAYFALFVVEREKMEENQTIDNYLIFFLKK